MNCLQSVRSTDRKQHRTELKSDILITVGLVIPAIPIDSVFIAAGMASGPMLS